MCSYSNLVKTALGFILLSSIVYNVEQIKGIALKIIILKNLANSHRIGRFSLLFQIAYG